jgi:hypothetical protein
LVLLWWLLRLFLVGKNGMRFAQSPVRQIANMELKVRRELHNVGLTVFIKFGLLIRKFAHQ